MARDSAIRRVWLACFATNAVEAIAGVWVHGHAGHEYNERCDVLATTFADSL